MHLSGFNTRLINAEPMNGRGSYPVAAQFDPSWMIAQRVASAASLVLSWGVRQFSGAVLPAAWNVRQRAVAQKVIAWDARQFAGEVFSTIWHITGGVQGAFRVSWRIPFQAVSGSSLACLLYTSPSPRDRG